MDTALVVVGDHHTAFHAHRGAIAATEVLDLLRTGNLPTTVALAVGQGVTDPQLRELAELTERGGHRLAWPSALRHAPYPHPRDHALIGPLTRTGSAEFRADLLMDERVRVLDDHLNGQHTPAVTLIEAARQAWTIATEQHLLDQRQRADSVISEIRDIRSSFHRYLFPLPANVVCVLTARTPSAAGELFDFDTTIHQGGVLAARIKARIHVVPTVLARKQELLAARQCLRDELDRCADRRAATEQG
ncbi:MAG TPA: AfsA-related hotdog domain-containing protein [Pseudonocardiaceae bacterium]|jgi:hypothetical protein|nr:AfsA-related hotdog domain-containing protein [Pseudonocardiaceae bacterium]